MKVYITSDERDKAKTLSNVINSTGNSAILSEEPVRTHEEMIDDVSEHLNYGFDVHVLISKEPVEASLVANKAPRIRAVICRTPADAKRARKARANVIIFDSAEFERGTVADIMGGWFSSRTEQPAQDDAAYYPSAPRREIDISGIGKGLLGSLGIQRAEVKPPRERQEKRQTEPQGYAPEAEAQKPKKGAGVVKNIKYIFGLD